MLKERSIFLLFVFFVSLNYVRPTKAEDEHPFDLLIFTQEWPQTVCKEWIKNNPTHTCVFPKKPDSWTIHGVWPTKLHTLGPAFCNRSWHFDPEAVRPIEAPLTELWTNIEGQTKVYALWAHEWTKHGTCAAVLQPLNTELKYFTNGLNWMKKYSMVDILGAHNILPSNDKEYSLADINKAIVDTLHVNPAIECRNIEGKNWLVEIRICFNKTLQLTNCDGILKFKHKLVPTSTGFTNILTNCDVKANVLYSKDVGNGHELHLPPKRLIVQIYKLISWLQWFTL